ncbi:MAG TPA: GntR family transcriptional regulator [Euzebyales bacterium]|nr:GntR family transcriptional regulator [Euzebyales bacterium]
MSPAKYQNIADELRAAIHRGDYGPGDALPSETQLCATYSVSRPTVRHAVAIMRSEGLIDVEHGRGAFVRRRPMIQRHARNRHRHARASGRPLGFDYPARHGQAPGMRITRTGPVRAPADVAARMGIDEASPAFIRERIVFADGEPVELSASYFPQELATGTDLAVAEPLATGVLRYVEDELGRRYHHIEEELTARVPSVEEAEVLRISTALPVLRVLYAAYDPTGDVIEVVDSLFPSDRHAFFDSFDLD